MKIDDLKPIAAFSEYTIRPIVEELRYLTDVLQKNGIKVDKKLFRTLSKHYFIYLAVNFVQTVIVTLIICFTAWKVL
jgi:hypothetical protein